MELLGKKIAFLGDSITEGTGVSDLSNRYDRRLLRECGLAAAMNDGIGGTRIAHQTKPSEKPRYDLCFCGRVYNLDPEADAVVVFGGTNDYGHGDAPFGDFSDKTPESFCGGVRFLMDFLYHRYAGKPIVFMAPARRNGDEAPSCRRENDTEAYPLLKYVDAIKVIAREYGIHVLDLYRTLGIDPNKEEERAAYAPDGLHFNDAGHALIAERLKALLVSI